MALTLRTSLPSREDSSDPLEDLERYKDEYEVIEKETIFTLNEDRQKAW